MKTSAGGRPSQPDLTVPSANWEDFRSAGHAAVDRIADYYKALAAGDLPVSPAVEPGFAHGLFPKSAPEEGAPLDECAEALHRAVLPGILHWQSPAFMGYFSANSSPAGLIGEMMSGAFNVIGFSWAASPACTEVEAVAMDWLAEAIGLPEIFRNEAPGPGGGVIQGTASEATLVALLAARARAESVKDEGTTLADLRARMVVYTSDQAHSSVKKATMIAGIDPALVRVLPAAWVPAPPAAASAFGGHIPTHNWSLQADALRAAMAADAAAGLVPIFVCATIGTTSTGGVDDVAGLASAAREHAAWLHVDAAWAGAALVCDEYRELAAGVEHADSFDFNPHKWLLTNFDCSAFYVRDKAAVLDALSLTPAYLQSKQYEAGLVQDYRDWQVPLGRRFRALKLMLVMQHYGLRGLRDHIRRSVALAAQLAARIQQHPALTLTSSPSLGLVCFRLAGSDEDNMQLMHDVNAEGQCMFIHTKVHDQVVLRLATGGALMTEASVASAWAAIERRLPSPPS